MGLSMPRIRYNSPVILTFALLSTVVLILFTATGTTFYHLFSAPVEFKLFSPFMYLRFVSHIFGHKNLEHLLNNFMIILLIGPLVEEKYSSLLLLIMIAITAMATGILNITLFSTGLMGASGIAFMLIVLGSLTNFQRGEIPLTFLLITAIFLGNEALNSFRNDNISQFAHVLGGVCGASFGLLFAKE